MKFRKMTVFVLSALTALSMSSPAFADTVAAGTPAQAETDGPKMYALILDGCRNDAIVGSDNDAAMIYDRLLHNELADYQVSMENIHPFYYNSKTDPLTKEDINKRIAYSLYKTKDNDLTIFFYSGHCRGDGKSAANYGISLGGSDLLYGWHDLASYLADHVRGNIVVILDGCFSAYFQQNGVASLSEDDQKRFSVITSCAEDEFSSTRTAADSILYGSLNYGCFSYYIGRGTGFFDDNLYADKDGDHKITFQELYDYTSKQVAADRKKTSSMTVCAFSQNRDQVLFAYTPSIELNQTDLHLKKGEKFQLSAAKKNTGEKVKWKSADKKIAAVSGKGMVTAKKAGKTTISASAGGATAECKITVTGSGQSDSKKKTAIITKSQQKQLKKLAKKFTNTSGLKLLSMSPGSDILWKFSKESNRRSALQGICADAPYKDYDKISGQVSQSYVQKWSKRIFGKKTADTRFNVGEWGASGPELGAIKITKSGKKYRVTCNVYWQNDSTKEKMGTMVLTMKKNHKAYYGFYVSVMKLKRN